MSPRGAELAKKFARNFIEYKWERGRRLPFQTFAAYIPRKNHIHFHIGQYKQWRAYLADIGVPDHGFTEVTYGFVDPEPLNAPMLPTELKPPRDYQDEIFHTYLKVPEPSWRKFVGIDPGRGKTYLASWAAAEYNFRIVGFLCPKFLKKWPSDLVENLGLAEEDIISVAGAASLMDVIARAKEGTLTEKAILISNRTYMNYINLYEKHGDEILNMGYDCTPPEFCQVIRAGTRIKDEVHEEFFSMFKIDLYTHIPRAISLSATLEDDDPFTESMYKIAYPVEERCKIVVRAKYITSYALRYHIKKGEELSTTERGSTMYSHIAFEKNFYSKRYSFLMKPYLELINERFEERFLTRFDPGQKCLIYAASIQMCTTIVDFLKSKHPDLDIRRYVAEDPYDNLMNATVCVSTLGSAGTGHDIKGLITVLMTTSLRARKKNIQGPGRLRETPGVDMEFEYFTCMDVPKQVEYHVSKELLLPARMKQCFLVDLPYTVGEK
ncbi:putative RAD2/SF2 helicase [Ralstonia phage RP12]|uniref:Putative RAD2/SF2 helicase n=1 Tax=Ralstonia phage RP12 TaxID=1923889 RepID=A0A1L7N178_9CAUD|nr:DNA helicase [Ralstonia phage RP12]BAW19241.1 putative RAD2/SF2 helicase [Ralstonia phage RP12]